MMWTACMLSAAALAAEGDPVLQALDRELQRTLQAYGSTEASAPGEQPPYYLGYRVVDGQSHSIRARNGALARDRGSRRRMLDVTARVGSPQLDNTHEVRDAAWVDFPISVPAALPIEDDLLALRHGVWSSTFDAVRHAQERYARVIANRRVKVEEDQDADDFSVEEPVVDIGPVADFAFDSTEWSAQLRDLSGLLNAHPEVERGEATLTTSATTEYLVNSEGTRIRQATTWGRVALSASTTAEDGAKLQLYRWQDVHEQEAWPSPETLTTWATDLRDELVALRAAPEGQPHTGPVLLKGAAAGVFIHEVLGHRSEGHRQKATSEGQTFRDKVGQLVMPTTISIVDDPRLESAGGQHLNGHYRYDQEGVPAQAAVLVENGVYRGFLMGRSPVPDFPRSNGHGRAQVGHAPVARMGNTVITTTDPRPLDELRAQLVALAREQGRDHGLLVEEIDGGFTLTGRVMPNAFNVRVTTARRVYVDGRPDELVRGVDLVGTPLVALTNIVAAGDDVGVFNGFCGAESGSVPNSAVSPSLLIRQLEVQKKEKGQTPPPQLPKPTPDAGGAA